MRLFCDFHHQGEARKREGKRYISVGMHCMAGEPIFNKKKWDMFPDANHLFIIGFHYAATLEKNKVCLGHLFSLYGDRFYKDILHNYII